MALKDFDYKQFFFDKGERIGLGAAGVIALLLVLTLFVPGMGFMSPSADANAKTLTTAAQTVEKGLQTNQPTEADKPGDPTDKLVAFNFDMISDAKAQDYLVAGLFDGRKPVAAQRQMPEQLLPRESRVAVVRCQLPSLVFDDKLQYLETLKGVVMTAGAPGSPPGTASSMGPAAGGSSMPSAGSLDTLYNGRNQPGFNPMAALGATQMGARFKKRGLLASKSDPNADKGDQDYETVWLPVDKIKDIKDMKLAEQAYPLRAAEIVADFPYKEQIQEFRDKLRLPSDAAVLFEPSLETKDGRPLAAFRFLGVDVERRQIDAQGKPVGEKDGWVPLDLDGTYKPLIVLNGKRLEDEDPKLKPVIFPGLVMKKLQTFGDRRTPPLDEYPKLETELPAMKATLEALDKKSDLKVATPSFSEVPGSIFDLPDQGTGASGMTPGPGGSMAVPGGSSMPIPGGSSPTFPGTLNPNGTTTGQELTIPDACLIRLFDVTIEPGKTYEYRMRVRMANPNYGRKDAASQGYADKKVLPVDNWYVLPQKVTVPSELYFYAVDQKDLDAKEGKDTRDPREKLPVQPIKDKDNQTVLQIQGWLEYVHTKSRADLPVGDWVVAERVVAARGEPIGKQRAEVPYWRTTQDRFTLANDVLPPKSGASKIPPSVEVPFAPEGEEPILVDFTGGDLTYKRTHPKTDDAAAAADQPLAVQDKAAVEVLLYTPDGRLLAHNSVKDAADPDRIQRLKDARDWVQSVKNAKGGKTNDKPF